MLKLINVLYFAALREQAAQEQESRQTAAHTPAELYTELQAVYHFNLPKERLRVAVNHAFIPPVSGG